MCLLWSITDPNADLVTHVRAAANCYQRRFGVKPIIAWIHPALEDGCCSIDGIEIKVTKKVPKNYVLVGVKGN